MRWLPPLLTGTLFLVSWYAVKSRWDLPRYTLPSPGEVSAAAWAERAVLARAAGQTLAGAALGYAGAAVSGFSLSLVLACSRRFRLAAYPWVFFLQMIPVIVMGPILVVWLGPGLHCVALIAFLISFFPIVANTTLGLLSADRASTELFKMYGANKWQELFWLRAPSALPHFFTGLKIAATLAVIGAVTGELFAGTGGLGYLLVYGYKASAKIPELFAAAFAACGLGFLFVLAAVFLQWFFLRKWHESELEPDL